MTNKFFSVAISTIALIFSANQAWAVQTHGGAEGLVAHQIGHFLFILGMGYVLFRLRTMRRKGKGWTEFNGFVWLLVAWNVMTFIGHWMDEFVAKENFVTNHANALYFNVSTLFDAMFYLTRLDHLVLVPAFAFLLLALRKWRLQL